jgi:hypothetical protein
LIEPLKADPSNFAEAQRVLHLTNSVNVGNADKPDLNFLAGVLKPKLAYQCFLLGLDLQINAPSAAVAMYERSLSLPFTDDDKNLFSKYVSSHWAIANSMSGIDWEKYLRQSTKENLLSAYKNAHALDKAQQLAIDLANAQPSGLPSLSQSGLSGQIQAQTGARVIEGKIRAAEPENKQSSNYWLTRASYFLGRKDKSATVAAYEKALSLCLLKTETDFYTRGAILNSYTHALRTLGAPDTEIEQLLEREFHLADPGTHYMQCVVTELLFAQDQLPGANSTTQQLLAPNNKKLWDHLRAEHVWFNEDSRLLLRMVQAVPQDEQSQFWTRAAQLPINADASKAYWLGDALKRVGRNKLAIQMFQRSEDEAAAALAAANKAGGNADLIKKSADEYMISTARMELFACFIALNDWRSGDRLWRQQSDKATPDTRQSMLAQLSLAAARAGDKAQSLQFWKEKSAIDRNELGWLGDIAAAGMKSDLTAFYRKMSQEDPRSSAPAAALAVLSAVRN